jgi:hypothetical protein
MARVPLTFRQRDVTAAIKAVEAAGHKIARVLISREGDIVMELAPSGENGTAPDSEEQPNPWDELHEGNQAP